MNLLTNRPPEINRVIKSKNLKPSFDAKAAVKWITWNNDQWVSYDDGQTMQMKMQYANKRVSKIGPMYDTED
jgi:chitinase